MKICTTPITTARWRTEFLRAAQKQLFVLPVEVFCSTFSSGCMDVKQLRVNASDVQIYLKQIVPDETLKTDAALFFPLKTLPLRATH